MSLVRALMTSLALTLALPSVAQAADKITEIKAKYPPCTERASADAEEQARGHHKLAMKAFEDKRWLDAADLWTKAYALDCSRPRVFKNLGQAFEGAGDVHAAIAMYELLAERAPTEVPDDLPPKIHDLRVAAQKLDDAAAANGANEKPVDVPAKPVVMERPLGVAPWVIVGVGGGVVVGGAVLLGVGLSQASSAEDACADPAARTGCTEEAVDDGESGELMSQIGQGLLYGGAGVVALGIILQFAANGEQPSDDQAAATALRWSVAPLDEGAAVVVGGRF